MKKFVAVLAMVGGLGAASSAVAGDTICPPAIVGGTHDNILVPPGMVCLITGATVKGNIKALENSRLIVTSSSVGGNIDGDKADVVQVFAGVVGGNIQIKEGGPVPLSVFEVMVCGVSLPSGDIQVEKMTGDILVGDPSLGCKGNTVSKGNIKVEENVIFSLKLNVGSNIVGQNLQVFKNRTSVPSPSGSPKFVTSNTVLQILQCQENDPPFFGGPNNAAEAEGQCF